MAFHCKDFVRASGAAAALLLAMSAHPLAAKEFPPVGASGDASFRDVCPAGQYLIGLRIRSGSWMDQLSITCAPVNNNGSLGVQWHGPARGGNGGGPSEKTCNPGHIINSMGFVLTAGNRQVVYFHFGCRSTTSDQADPLIIGANSGVFPSINQNCGPDEVAVGIQGRYGKHVNAAGLICGKKPIPTALYDAFKTWLTANRIVNATISNGEFATGFGSRRADDVVPLASLSKAITASCIAQLVDAGRLAYTDTIATRLPRFIRANKPADSRFGGITIEQLLRHTSGITTDPVIPTAWTASKTPNTASADEAFAKAAAAANLGGTPGAASVYNNVNYAILGMIIKAVATTYEAHCKPILFGGSLARIGAGTQGMGAFGGWEMSARTYAQFISNHYRRLSASAERFMQASYGVMYGLGVQVRKTTKGRNIWHTGNWPSFANWGTAPITNPANFSSYFAMWDTGTLVVVTMDQHFTSNAQVNSLDAALRAAAGIP